MLWPVPQLQVLLSQPKQIEAAQPVPLRVPASAHYALVHRHLYNSGGEWP